MCDGSGWISICAKELMNSYTGGAARRTSFNTCVQVLPSEYVLFFP